MVHSEFPSLWLVGIPPHHHARVVWSVSGWFSALRMFSIARDKKEKGESTDRFYLLLMDSGLVSDLDEFLGLRFWREWCRLPGFMGTQNTSRAMQAGTFMGSRIYMHQKRRRRRNILGSNHKCVHRLQKYLNRMITGHKIVTLLNCTLVPTLD